MIFKGYFLFIVIKNIDYFPCVVYIRVYLVPKTVPPTSHPDIVAPPKGTGNH